MYTRDIERVARGMLAQKLEVEYVRYYLMETYQLDLKIANQVLEKLGVAVGVPKGPKGKGTTEKAPDKSKVQKQTFY